MINVFHASISDSFIKNKKNIFFLNLGSIFFFYGFQFSKDFQKCIYYLRNKFILLLKFH